MGEEHVWTKRGSRIHLRGPSRSTLLRAIAVLGVASLSLIGLLAVPAGSPTPPPPAVAATPIASSSPTDTPTADPVVEPTPSEQPAPPDPPPAHCVPRARPVPGMLAPGTIVYQDETSSVYLYDPSTGKRRLLLSGTGSCGFGAPRFLNAHTIAFNLSSPYMQEAGSFTVDIQTGKMQRIAGSRRDWAWVATTRVSPDGSKLAELGEVGQANSFLLRVTSTRTGAVLFSRSMGYICYCDGGYGPPIEIRWSPDSAYLFVSVPGSNYNELSLLDTKGRDVRKMTEGGYPRWIGASHAFMYQDVKANWVRADSLTAAPRAFLSSGASFADPAPSPDGDRIAFWDTGKWNIVIYDLSTKNLERYGHRQVYPFWIDNGTIAVSSVRSCTCEGLGFEFTSIGWSITLRTGGMHRIPVLSINADVLR